MGGANVLSGVGSIVKVAGIMQQQDADAAASVDNEAALRRQATIDAAMANDSIARGARTAGLARMQGSRTIADQKVAFSASGVDATVGTPADLAGSTAMMSQVDADTITNNAAREAWGHRESALQYTTKANLEPGKRDAGNTAGILSSFGTLFGGGR